MTSWMTCPLCLRQGASLHLDKKGRPFLKCACSTTFIRGPEGLRSVRLFSDALRRMLDQMGPAKVIEADQAAVRDVEQIRASAAVSGPWN